MCANEQSASPSVQPATPPANPTRTLLASWLRAIPQSRHEPRPLSELPGDSRLGEGWALMLQVWGAVEITPQGIRAISQPAYYFLHSLAAWAETPGAVVSDWSQQQGASATGGLDHGSSLVYLLENERLARYPDAPPIRFTNVAHILVVRPGNPPRFLVQWDPVAGAYQLIGGRQKEDRGWVEPILTTAVREFEEELHSQVSYEAGDFQLEFLAECEAEKQLSPTFGALTAYHFTFYQARGLRPLTLQTDDRWLTRAALLAGETSDGKPVRGDHIRLLEQTMARSIEQLPSSFLSSPSLSENRP